MKPRGEVIGKPAFGLTRGDTSWAVNDQVAEIGADGERATARVLNEIASMPGGPTVLHDVSVPASGMKVNMDHVVVSGREVTIIDTKVWKPGFYWTLLGCTWRGFERFRPAETRAVSMARDKLSWYLIRRHAFAKLRIPEVWVWPSSQFTPLRLWAMNFPDAMVLHGQKAAKYARHSCYRSADPRVVSALIPLVASINR